MELRKGDLGYVRGRTGLWVISAGAPPPEGIVPCSVEARRRAEAADPIAVWAPGGGEHLCERAAFIPLQEATPADHEAAFSSAPSAPA